VEGGGGEEGRNVSQKGDTIFMVDYGVSDIP